MSNYLTQPTNMKKQYIRPEMQVNELEIASICEVSMRLGEGYAEKGSTGLSRERGSRSESDDFDDLW